MILNVVSVIVLLVFVVPSVWLTSVTGSPVWVAIGIVGAALDR